MDLIGTGHSKTICDKLNSLFYEFSFGLYQRLVATSTVSLEVFLGKLPLTFPFYIARGFLLSKILSPNGLSLKTQIFQNRNYDVTPIASLTFLRSMAFSCS